MWKCSKCGYIIHTLNTEQIGIKCPICGNRIFERERHLANVIAVLSESDIIGLRKEWDKKLE